MNTEINLQEEFGRCLYDTVLEYNLCRNIEIGSWDGEGSTHCFVEAMKVLQGAKKLACIELIEEKCKILSQRYKDVPFVEAICNSSISYDELAVKDFNEIWQSPFNNLKPVYDIETVRRWYERDIDTLTKIKSGALSTLVKQRWDSVLIDGGEFTGYSEFKIIEPHVRFIFLDDVHNAYKCNEVYHELKNNKRWVIIAENSSVRNGYAIFKLI